MEVKAVPRFNKRRSRASSIYSFIIAWIFFSAFFPLYEVWGLLLSLGACLGIAYLIGRASAKKEVAKEQKEAEVKEAPKKTTYQQVQEQDKQEAAAKKKSYGPKVDPIVEEGNKALAEMGRLYMSIKDPQVRGKINEIMRITDKIVQDAITDPADIPQIKKFMTYYLPTTIKLLNAYDRMSSQGIEGENLDKSMKNINEMLDDAIEAYKKMLDSLFANQALDIETEIDVMNTMLAREGLSGEKDFQVAAGGQGGR